MDAYMYRAAFLCEDCAMRYGLDVCRNDRHDAVGPWCDSECMPVGPYVDGGGEADSPQHYDSCGVFLENPLTDDGRAYLRDATGASDVLTIWRTFYADSLAR